MSRRFLILSESGGAFERSEFAGLWIDSMPSHIGEGRYPRPQQNLLQRPVLAPGIKAEEVDSAFAIGAMGTRSPQHPSPVIYKYRINGRNDRIQRRGLCDQHPIKWVSVGAGQCASAH